MVMARKLVAEVGAEVRREPWALRGLRSHVQFILMVVFLSLAVLMPASAMPVLSDGDFESGVTVPGGNGGWDTLLGFPTIGPNTAQSGFNAASFNEFGGPGPESIFQNLMTQTGQSYNLSFFVETSMATSVSPSSFSWDGGAPTAIALTPSAGYTQFTFNNLIASGTSTPLAFSFASNGPVLLDNVSVNSSSVPELDPSSAATPIALCACAFLLVGDRRQSSKTQLSLA